MTHTEFINIVLVIMHQGTTTAVQRNTTQPTIAQTAHVRVGLGFYHAQYQIKQMNRRE